MTRGGFLRQYTATRVVLPTLASLGDGFVLPGVHRAETLPVMMDHWHVTGHDDNYGDTARAGSTSENRY